MGSRTGKRPTAQLPRQVTFDWEDLRVFAAAHEFASFSKAAEALGVGQATVSRRIAALEEAVGHVLFDRTRAGLVGTPAATLLLPFVESMRASAQAASAASAGFEVAPTGKVRLALPTGMAAEILAPLVPALRRRFPELRLELVTDGGDVGRHEVDVAIVNEAPARSDLLVRRLADVPFGVFASTAYVRGLPRPTRLADVEFIGWSGRLAEIAPARWLATHVDRPFVVTADDTLVVSALARRSVGAVIFPTHLARTIGLTPVPVTVHDLPSISFFLVVHRALRRVPRVASVVDFVVEAAFAV